ncbi:shikimate kinase [Brevibacillus daliensis]|uniref:shikimate kinase n=1 Tax=Brevibacillus daliensis TaxID=2892995 RepID=UPI001E523513|nr:shikimate kinase [Brevibacillus daliensis]
MEKRNNIILIGFMGTGKTTVGVELAHKLGSTARDLDAEIVATVGKSIPEIFAEHGEKGFRDWESKILAQLIQEDNQIIITGGGAVLRAENVRLMKEGCYVVALTATEDEIIRRVSQDENRPLLAGNVKERVRTLLVERAGAYDFAHIQIDTTGKSIENIVEFIVENYG